MSHRTHEDGAAAVEFAIVLTLLLTLVLGTVEFGRYFMFQAAISNAARVAARTMAIESATGGFADPVGDAKSKAIASANGVVVPGISAGSITISPSTVPCSPAGTISVTIAYTGYAELTNFLPQAPSGFFPDSVTGKASAQCGG